MKPEEFVKRKNMEKGPPMKRWLTAKMDFKMGVGYVFDPTTGEQFGNWVGDWEEPSHSDDGWFLSLYFKREDVGHVEYGDA